VTTLLQIIATPHTGESSRTRRVARHFVDAWQTVHPTGSVETVDLAQVKLPPLDSEMVAVLFDQPSPGRREQLARKRAVLDEIVGQFKAADAYLFVTPMWNFGLPAVLKHYFDLVIRPGWTFALGEQGPVGLLGGRTACAVITRGFDYGPTSANAAHNHLEPHLHSLLGFMGIEELSVVAVEGTMLPGADERMEAGIRAATAMGLGLVAA